MSSTLGVSTLLYLPFAFFNIISPLLSLAYGITGFKIERLADHKHPDDGRPDYASHDQPGVTALR